MNLELIIKYFIVLNKISSHSTVTSDVNLSVLVAAGFECNRRANFDEIILVMNE